MIGFLLLKIDMIHLFNLIVVNKPYNFFLQKNHITFIYRAVKNFNLLYREDEKYD